MIHIVALRTLELSNNNAATWVRLGAGAELANRQITSGKMGRGSKMGLFTLGWFLLWSVHNAFGWDEHFHITRAALERSFSGKERVVYVPLSKALQRLTEFRARNEAQLKKELKINTHTEFPLRLKEEPGKTVALLDVLSSYSDEPDWGADQDLFEADQYPELWTKDSAYVTRRTGMKSQAFRHMYFPGHFLWTDPVGSIQIPMRPLGEAPERAALFYRLGRDFLAHQQPYWGARFTAWAMHYMEDLFQPFHSRQTPSKRFIVFSFKNLIPKIDVDASTEQVGYYHLSYERWVAERMRPPEPTLAPSLIEEVPNAFTLDFNSPLSDQIKNTISVFAASRAGAIGSGSIALFAKYTPKAGVEVESFVKSPEWRSASADTVSARRLLSTTREIFAQMGSVIRGAARAMTPLAISQKEKR